MYFKRPIRKENSENIVPLINIIFLLLIFFMVTAKLTPKDPFAMTAPKSIASLIEEEKMQDVLYLSINGQLSYNNILVSKSELSHQLNPKHFSPERIPLFLQADAQTPVRLLMEIMSLLKTINIKNIELLTLKDS